MNNDNKAVSFSFSYDESDDKMIISFENEQNSISIPANVYLPFISVLIKAGMDFQEKGIVDLGMTKFNKVDIIGENNYVK